MTTWRRLLLLVLLLPAASASGQGLGVALDAGMRQDVHANGLGRSNFQGALALDIVMGGWAEKRWALLFPAAGELRWSPGGDIELNADVDAMLRLGPVAAGAGLAVRTLLGPTITANDGTEHHILGPTAAGYSLAVKATVWPGRLFLQGRYVWLPGHLDGRGRQLVCGGSVCTTLDIVEYTDGAELKLSAGWVFRGGLGRAYVIRLQYVGRSLSFSHTGDNLSGVYDRSTRMMSIGLVQYF
jgi:hypothetical protein